MDRLIFRVHAIKRMFQQHISESDVRNALANGETIETYPSDNRIPANSCWDGARNAHCMS